VSTVGDVTARRCSFTKVYPGSQTKECPITSGFFTRIGDTTVGWPRVRATCEYKAPLRFEDEFEILLTVREKKMRSLTYDFSFTKLTGELVATGTLTAVCVTLDEPTGRMKAAKIPEEITAVIEAAPVVDA